MHHTQCCRGEFDKEFDTEAGYAQKDPHMRKMEAEAYLLGNGFLFRDWEDSLREKKGKITMAENKNIKEGGPRGPFGSGSSELFKSLADLLQKMREKGQNEQSILDNVKDLLTPAKDHEDEGLANKLTRDANQMEEAIMSGEETTEPEGRFSGAGAGTKPDGEDTEPVMEEEDNNASMLAKIKAIAKKAKSRKEASELAKKRFGKEGEEALRKFLSDEKESKPMKDYFKEPSTDPGPVGENWKKGNKDQLLFERLMEKWAK